MCPSSQQTSETRQRLLEAATEVFAEQGFRNARVRDICDRAQANVAAINYHFGDKKGLYAEVLHQGFQTLTGGDPTEWGGVAEDAPPGQRLHAFVTTMLTQLLADGRGATHARLVAREMVDPSDAITRVIDEGIRPQVELLLHLVRDRLGSSADEQQVRRCASSILGQCLFYYFARPAIIMLPLEPRLHPEAIEPIAAHITAFSLASLEHLARQAQTL